MNLWTSHTIHIREAYNASTQNATAEIRRDLHISIHDLRIHGFRDILS
jgi:hypothetical protein